MDKKGQSAIESPAAITRTLRGQSAMEYLMTYGWAILIIIIVIAVLFYLGVLSPSNITPTACAFPPNFACVSFKLQDTTGTLSLRMGQAVGQKIYFTSIACSQAEEPPGWTDLGVYVNNGEQADADFLVNCTDVNGTVRTSLTGETAAFKLWLNYTEVDTSTPRQVRGDITARYEPA